MPSYRSSTSRLRTPITCLSQLRTYSSTHKLKFPHSSEIIGLRVGEMKTLSTSTKGLGLRMCKTSRPYQQRDLGETHKERDLGETHLDLLRGLGETHLDRINKSNPRHTMSRSRPIEKSNLCDDMRACVCEDDMCVCRERSRPYRQEQVVRRMPCSTCARLPPHLDHRREVAVRRCRQAPLHTT